MPLTQNSELECLPPVDISPGNILHCFHDPSKPTGSSEAYWTEVEYTGEPGAPPLEVPRHWHKHHDERWEVLEGRIEVFSGGETFVLSVGDAPRHTPRRTVHGLKAFEGERMVLRESTTPAGPFKEAQSAILPRTYMVETIATQHAQIAHRFFRDLFHGGQPGFWSAMRTFRDGDNYPHLGLRLLWIDELFLFFFGSLARLFVPANQMGNTMAIPQAEQKKEL